MKLLKSLVVLVALLAPSMAWAQNGCNGQLFPGTVCGNPKSTQAGPMATANPVLGASGTTTGTLGLTSLSGGTTTIFPPSIGGSLSLQLPSLAGTIPTTAVSPILLNSTTGAVSCPTCITGTTGAITANVTTTSGFTAGQFVYSDGSKVQAASLIPLSAGGLNGSQSAATARQVPVFPGSGGAAVPTTLTTAYFNNNPILSPVQAASTGNVNISSAPSSLDGVSGVAGDRWLLKDQSTPSQNGIYQFNGSGSALTRTADFNTTGQVVQGTSVRVTQGAGNANSLWYVSTADPITVGTTSIAFSASSEWPNAGPAWTTYSTLYDPFRFTVGPCPLSMETSNNSYGTTQTLVGCVDDTSVTSTGTQGFNAGISGYSRTVNPYVSGSAVGHGAVGVFSGGLAAANNTSAWGANFTSTNAAQFRGVSNTNHNLGFTANQWGIEIDQEWFQLSNGSAPGGNATGISIIGAGEIMPTGGNNFALNIYSLCEGTSTPCNWASAFHTNAGAAPIGIDLAPSTKATSSIASQSIVARSINGASTAQSGSLQLDLNGNWVITPASGAANISVGSLAISGTGDYLQLPGGTSGTQILRAQALGAADATLPNCGSACNLASPTVAQSWTALQTFADQMFQLSGSSSGATKVVAAATASGTITIPSATDTLVGKATTDTLTNKTYDTAGTGNSFSINGVAATANTGTGAVARANSPAFTGTPTAPTASPGNNSTQLATTAYADAIAALKANLVSPTFTGTPAAPTAAASNNSTQIATTAYVDRAAPQGAWTAWTPTITCTGGGTITSYTTSPSGRYFQQGKTVMFTMNFTVNNTGTCAGNYASTLPGGAAAAARTQFLGWWGNVPKQIVGNAFTAADTTFQISDQGFGTTVGAGSANAITGTVEIQ